MLIKKIESDRTKLETSFRDLLADMETIQISSIIDEIDSKETCPEKTECLKNYLTIVNNYKKRIDDLLNETKVAKSLKIIHGEKFDIDDMFGKMTSNCDEKFVSQNEILKQQKNQAEDNLKSECESRNEILEIFTKRIAQTVTQRQYPYHGYNNNYYNQLSKGLQDLKMNLINLQQFNNILRTFIQYN